MSLLGKTVWCKHVPMLFADSEDIVSWRQCKPSVFIQTTQCSLLTGSHSYVSKIRLWLSGIPSLYESTEKFLSNNGDPVEFLMDERWLEWQYPVMQEDEIETYTRAHSSRCSTPSLHSSSPSHSGTAHCLPQNRSPCPWKHSTET